MTTDPREPWTVLRLINWTAEFLTKAHVESPRLAAEVLLAHVLTCKRIELYTRFDFQPAAGQLETYRELVKKAREQTPIAYLVGHREFYSLDFKVTSDVLIPRPETELLVSEAVGYLKKLGRPGRVWDACTGSGCVAVAVASQVAEVAVLATDISPVAVAVAAENAVKNKVEARVRCRVADLLTLPEDCADAQPVDVVTANPPYVARGAEVAASVKHEPEIALYAGKDGLELVRKIVAQAPAVMAAGGMLAMEFGFDQADAVRDIIVKSGAFAEPKILKDQQGIDRAAVAAKK